MKINKDYILRETAGEYILVPITGTLNFNGIIALNQMGGEIYRLCADGLSEDALIERICADYDAPEAQITADIREYLKKLRQEHVLLD